MSSGQEPRTPTKGVIERARLRLQRQIDDLPHYDGEDPRARFYRGVREELECALAALSPPPLQDERLRKALEANLSTLEEQRRRCGHWNKSHAEIDTAIAETRLALAATPVSNKQDMPHAYDLREGMKAIEAEAVSDKQEGEALAPAQRALLTIHDYFVGTPSWQTFEARRPSVAALIESLLPTVKRGGGE